MDFRTRENFISPPGNRSPVPRFSSPKQSVHRLRYSDPCKALALTRNRRNCTCPGPGRTPSRSPSPAES